MAQVVDTWRPGASLSGPTESSAQPLECAGDRLSYEAATGTFQRLRRRLGWTAEGRSRTPRIHDLRHRMVVRRLQLWHAQGVDVDRKIAVLATYLGHVVVSDTYWYYSDSRVIPMPAPSCA